MAAKGALLAIGTPLAAVALLVMFVVVITPAQAVCSAQDASTVDLGKLPTEPVAGYSGKQLENAGIIMNAARDVAMPRSAQIIGLMTAIAESKLTATATTAAGGRGLFGQPDDPKWGTLENRLDPVISSANFYKELRSISGWQELTPTVAAHRVQGNADPFLYEKYQAKAEELFAGLAATNGSCLSGELAFPLGDGYNMTEDYGPRGRNVAGANDWHAAVDLQHYPNNCNDPIFAITSGTVTVASGYQISVKHVDGYTVSYLHMYPNDMLVGVGDPIETGDKIALTGDNGPATGCHVDVRINVLGSVVDAINDLPRSESIGGPTGFVDPEDFYGLFDMELCPRETCSRNYR